MRYIILVLVNLPVILMALVNTIVSWKTGKVSGGRFRHQMILWGIILGVLIGSFPIYNLMAGRAVFDASELSAFDIVEITVIVYLIYVVNYQRRRTEGVEKMVRDLHREIAIKISGQNGKS
jgi:hypothetical protein